MSPQLKGLLSGLLFVLRPMAALTKTTFDDNLVSFIEMALQYPDRAAAALNVANQTAASMAAVNNPQPLPTTTQITEAALAQGKSK